MSARGSLDSNSSSSSCCFLLSCHNEKKIIERANERRRSELDSSSFSKLISLTKVIHGGITERNTTKPMKLIVEEQNMLRIELRELIMYYCGRSIGHRLWRMGNSEGPYIWKIEKGVRDHLGLLTAVKTSVRCKSTENTGIKWVSWWEE